MIRELSHSEAAPFSYKIPMPIQSAPRSMKHILFQRKIPMPIQSAPRSMKHILFQRKKALSLMAFVAILRQALQRRAFD